MAKPDATPAPRDDSEAFRRLAPAVLKYSSRQFDLANDLKQLDRVQSVGASEASIFYSARILEALSAERASGRRTAHEPDRALEPGAARTI